MVDRTPAAHRQTSGVGQAGPVLLPSGAQVAPPFARPGREPAEGTRGFGGGEWPHCPLLLFRGPLSPLGLASCTSALGGACPGPGRPREGHAQPAPVASCGEEDPPRGDPCAPSGRIRCNLKGPHGRGREESEPEGTRRPGRVRWARTVSAGAWRGTARLALGSSW